MIQQVGNGSFDLSQYLHYDRQLGTGAFSPRQTHPYQERPDLETIDARVDQGPQQRTRSRVSAEERNANQGPSAKTEVIDALPTDNTFGIGNVFRFSAQERDDAGQDVPTEVAITRFQRASESGGYLQQGAIIDLVA